MENGKPENAIKLSDSVRETINQDGAVLLDIKQGICFSMNPVGAKIWELLKQGYPSAVIVDELEREFKGVARGQLEIDVTEFLNELQNRRLVNSGDEQQRKRPNLLVRFLSRKSS